MNDIKETTNFKADWIKVGSLYVRLFGCLHNRRVRHATAKSPHNRAFSWEVVCDSNKIVNNSESGLQDLIIINLPSIV